MKFSEESFHSFTSSQKGNKKTHQTRRIYFSHPFFRTYIENIEVRIELSRIKNVYLRTAELLYVHKLKNYS